jgi:hypothetical protein
MFPQKVSPSQHDDYALLPTEIVFIVGLAVPLLLPILILIFERL